MNLSSAEKQMMDDYLDAYIFFTDAYAATKQEYFSVMANNMIGRMRSYISMIEKQQEKTTKLFWDKWIY